MEGSDKNSRSSKYKKETKNIFTVYICTTSIKPYLGMRWDNISLESVLSLSLCLQTTILPDFFFASPLNFCRQTIACIHIRHKTLVIRIRKTRYTKRLTSNRLSLFFHCLWHRIHSPVSLAPLLMTHFLYISFPTNDILVCTIL